MAPSYASTQRTHLATLAPWHQHRKFLEPTKAVQVRDPLRGIQASHPQPVKQAPTLQLKVLEASIEVLSVDLHSGQPLTGIEQGPLLRGIDRWGNLRAWPLTANSVSQLLRRALLRSGVEAEEYSAHSLRRGFATFARGRNRPRADIQECGACLGGSVFFHPHIRLNMAGHLMPHMEIAMFPNKACPVVLSSSLPIRILLFRHPLAGTQLVKGTIENGETPSVAALRELAEESGISDAVIESDLGCWKSYHQGQIWSFHLCRAGRELPERWVHQTLDDHGHLFEFFWSSLDNLPYTDCHPVFQRALEFLCETLKASGHWENRGSWTGS